MVFDSDQAARVKRVATNANNKLAGDDTSTNSKNGENIATASTNTDQVEHS